MSTSSSASQPSPAAVKGLSVRYQQTLAVDQVSFEALPGSVLALLGRNGAGKSSIVRCLVGLLKPSQGETRLFGQSSWRHRSTLMAEVGVVAEGPELPPRATARQLAGLHRVLYPRWSDSLFAERLERFSIPGTAHLSTLSRGQQRQLQLALALAGQPRLLVLDDPTLGLDTVARRDLLEVVIETLADQGATVLVTTHDLSAIENVADQVAIIDHGRLLLNEPIEQLKVRFRRLVIDLDARPRQTERAIEQLTRPMAPLTWSRDGSRVDTIVSALDEQQVTALREAAGQVHVTGLDLEEIFNTVTSEDQGGRS